MVVAGRRHSRHAINEAIARDAGTCGEVDPAATTCLAAAAGDRV